ncbi:hypothetical protein N7470_008064 [Penicillium chermesinum]|nr:hypothetical protein N7470_008064 [Penicillium chermesinum]
MHITYSPPTTLLDFDQEVEVRSSLSERESLINFDSRNSLPSMMKRSAGYRSEHHAGPVPSTSGCGLLDNQQLLRLGEIPVSSSSSPAPSSALQQPRVMYRRTLNSYLSDQRASPVSDAMGSLYAWSSTSDADALRPRASSSDRPIAPATTSPYMPSYFPFSPSHSMDSQLHQVSGYTPQQINKWCLDSDHAGSFYTTQQPSYPAICPLSFSGGTEGSQGAYPSMTESVNGPASESWFSSTAFSGTSSPPVSAVMERAFLSPSSGTIPFDSPSVMSASPGATTPDFESPSSRHRHTSPSNPGDLSRYGIPTADGAWRCAHPGCTSQALFRRGCDLRKHYNRHRKHLFCRHEGCPQSQQGGFSSKKDRARHEAKHNPGIICEWDGCGRVFSRVDNMKDHVRRIHRRGGSS